MMFKKILKYAAIALATLIVLGAILFMALAVWMGQEKPYPRAVFSVQAWHTTPAERFQMAENMIDTNILIGKTKAEVSALLGDDYYKYTDDHWGYYLGFVPRNFSIDPDVLAVEFKDDTVLNVYQRGS